MAQCHRYDGFWACRGREKILLLAITLLLFLLIPPALADNLSTDKGRDGLAAVPQVSDDVKGDAASDDTAEAGSDEPSSKEESATHANDRTPTTEALPSDGKIETDSQEGEEELPGLEEEKPVHDPLQPWNRLMFHFNDKLYYWVMKPAAKGYNAVLPEPVRTSVGNFFNNVTMPVRFVSSLLAGRVKAAGIELARFAINTTAGLGGLFDIAKQYHLERQESDLGLTFGRYGIGEGIYIVWPFLGPSSLRDTVGTVGDGFLDPVNYVRPEQDAIAIGAYEYFNYAALHINDYEDLVKSAVEPYIALRNAYIEHRRSLINK